MPTLIKDTLNLRCRADEALAKWYPVTVNNRDFSVLAYSREDAQKAAEDWREQGQGDGEGLL